MEGKRSQNPDPFKTERVGHPEKLRQLLGVDVLEWYHSIVRICQQEKCERVGQPIGDTNGNCHGRRGAKLLQHESEYEIFCTLMSTSKGMTC